MPDNPKKSCGAKKIPLHLVPPTLTLGAARGLKEGADKYGPYNWREAGVDTNTYTGAMLRHLLAYMDGEDVDPESKVGKTHLEGIAACCAILMDAGPLGKLEDNRPPKGKAAELIRAYAPPDQESKQLPKAPAVKLCDFCKRGYAGVLEMCPHCRGF